jgi:DNA polymerase-4
VAENRLAIRLIGIGVSSLGEPGMQLSLINNSEQRLEKLNRAIDRIRDKYGFTAIQTGRTIDLK